MSPNETWKHLERIVAEMSGGERVPITGRIRGSAPDVEHGKLGLEVKHRKSLPLWLKDAVEQAFACSGDGQIPTVVLHEKYMEYKDMYAIIPFVELLKLINSYNEE